jgi:4,5-DOPA dioxygenase extradiol
MSERMPVVFFGHGNPMNALLTNDYTQGWAAIGASLPKPKAVLSVSAHWYIPGVAVTAMDTPGTVHDFGGFPRELFEYQYPARGDPLLARRVQDVLAPITVEIDRESWGLDHGTWAVLCHVFPKADVPVVQLSIDETQPPAFHYEIGRRLRVLRDEGVLIVGSGDVVHNLHAYAWGRRAVEPYDWALRFETQVRELIVAGDHQPLAQYESLGRDALLSVPTPDHYLPLLYVLGASAEGEPVSFPVQGIDGGSVSMLSVRLG